MSPQNNDKTMNVFVLPTPSSEAVTPSHKKSFWTINKEMLKFKIHFFLYVGGLAAGLPFVVLLAKNRLGISATSLGAVLTTQMFLFVFTKPIIGYIADYFNRLKIIINVLITVHIVCYLLLLAIPKFEVENSQQNTTLLDIDSMSNYSDALKICDNYHQIYLKSFSQSVCNTSSVESLDSKFSNITLSHEIGTCSNFSENDFESLMQNFIKACTNSKDLYTLTTDEAISNPKPISHNFKILVFVNVNNNLSSKMCICSISQLQEQSPNVTHNSIDGSCDTSTDISVQEDFICVPSDYQNQTLYLSTSENPPKNKKDFETYQFWTFALLYTISAVSTNGVFTLSDTACFESLQKSGADFGQQRLWGGIGWGAVAPLAGFINDYTGNFIASFLLMSVMMTLLMWNMSRIDLVKPHYSKNILKDVGTVLKSRDFLVFEAVIFTNGLGTGLIWFYLIWFLTSIGGSELLCGLTLTVQSFLGVIPWMFFSGWIIRKLGHFNILTIALVGYAIRFMWYSYLRNPWVVLPVEFLHGITYGLYYTALVSYAKMSAKPGTEATTQAIVFSTHEGLGSGIGCVLGGIGFDYYGGHEAFFFASIFCACGVLTSLALSLILLKRKGIVRIDSAQDI